MSGTKPASSLQRKIFSRRTIRHDHLLLCTLKFSQLHLPNLNNQLLPLLKTIRSIGVLPGDSSEMRLRKFTIVIIVLCCCIAAPVWSLLYYLMGLYVPALGPILYFVVVVPALVYLIIFRNERPLINAQIIFIMLCPTFMQWTSG